MVFIANQETCTLRFPSRIQGVLREPATGEDTAGLRSILVDAAALALADMLAPLAGWFGQRLDLEDLATETAVSTGLHEDQTSRL
jgi:hypothetical protein